MSEELVETSIEGLKIKLGKVVPDSRGLLAELSPAGTAHKFFNSGINNIYISSSEKKHTLRAGHLHYKNIENFYTLSGTALWVFVDLRKESPTYNKIFSVVLGSKSMETNTDDPQYTLDKSQMAQILVPAGVYHAYWQLTDDPVIVLALASQQYDEKDYDRTPPSDIPNIREKVKSYNIVI